MSAGARRFSIAFTLQIALCAGGADAQQPAKGLAIVTGAVFDSLNGGGLRGAEVMLAGSIRTAVTDSSGRFTFADVKPGMTQVGVFHPLLDSLGLSLATRAFGLGADSVSLVILSVPSLSSLARQFCKSSKSQGGPAISAGRVFDPETGEPLRFARVAITWIQYDVSTKLGLLRSPNERHAYTDSSGRFAICGLPADLDARIRATRNNSATPEIGFAMGSRPLSLHSLAVTANPVPGSVGSAAVSGRVVSPEGAPLSGARIEGPNNSFARTSSDGEFSLSGLPSGSQLLLVRAIGYAASTVPVLLTSRTPERVTVKMNRYITMMEPVLVKARRERALEQVGFASRRRSGLGHYITRADIEKRNPTSLSDALRMAPGLRVIEVDGQPVIEPSRGSGNPEDRGCVRFIVDGVEWRSYAPGDTDAFMPPSEISAIEIYSAAATPAEYMSGGSGCTTVLIWSRTRVHDR